MPTSFSKPQSPAHLNLHVGTTSSVTTATAATATSNGSAASPGSAASSSPRAPTAQERERRGYLIRNGQINPACAACKYQRRKCGRSCLLAPYFPADQERRFLNAHRLFGVSNLTKTLKRIEPKYRPDAMRSLVYESDARAADPVGGCVRIIEELNRQIQSTEMELHLVRQQIAIHQASAMDGGGLSDPAVAAAAAMILPAAYPGMAGHQQDDMTAAVAAICAGQHPSIPAGDLRDPSSHSHQQQLYNYFCNNNGAAAGDEATSADDDGGMQQYGFAGVTDGSVKAASPAVNLGEQLGQHCQIQASPFVGAFDMKPKILPPATVQHHGPAQKKLGAPFKLEHDDDDVVEDDEDEHMEEEEQATAGAPCHMELGFSTSSFYA